MVLTDNGESACGGEETATDNVKSNTSLHVSTSQRGLITEETSQSGYNSSLSALPRMLMFLKFGDLASPTAKFHRIAEERDEVSRNVPSSSSLHIRERFQRIFSRRVDWTCLWKLCKEWIKDPMNLALFVWIVCVAVSGAILFMVMTGMLNHSIPKKSQRDTWFEVNNQILNALFTLMCLYQHPKRIYHLALLLRWRTEDVLKLRKIYCKNGTYKPHEWAHMMVVVILLHLNCYAQYALCGLNLGYKRSERPAIGVGICISVAIGAPAFAGVYSMLSPLGREYETQTDEEAQIQVTGGASDRQSQSRRMSFEKRFSFASRDIERTVERQPQWSGGILDFWDDISLAYLSLFCSFCVFGWNMERLGFGNMYVHIATFLLFCMAPFWIFNLAAVNINNETVREVLGITGIFLCIFGVLYGGFWRIQMRRRFNLPAYKSCCGKPAVSDCALWLFCCWCSLAQEVRTGNFYDIMENELYRKKEGSVAMAPLGREDGEFQFRSSPSSPFGNSPSPPHVKGGSTPPAHSPSPSRLRQMSLIEEEEEEGGDRDGIVHHKDEEKMIPPDPMVISR
ncbi:uncharacterized protein LOC127256432 [Andrographis paniculata]|uniref:uncharacterized protein LOC127256432 n=1 Tax=Andrographis paniculata TaxID=175694 RepID=UPI0021E87856|nr:uncharacterized protein LOC127256432 [Andrographis paniculata]XP_051138400.1 uncharacterized protein LOC127256432 [Andrographis paniculata]XP_051138401.1 uncharacterized protein LOC127256432 [Andrographis paniculata]